MNTTDLILTKDFLSDNIGEFKRYLKKEGFKDDNNTAVGIVNELENEIEESFANLIF